MNPSTSQKIGSAIFAIGVVYMLCWPGRTATGRRLPLLLHGGNARRDRLCLVPEPVEPVGLAVLIIENVQGWQGCHPFPSANDEK